MNLASEEIFIVYKVEEKKFSDCTKKYFPPCEYVYIRSENKNANYKKEIHTPEVLATMITMPLGTCKVGDKFKVILEKL